MIWEILIKNKQLNYLTHQKEFDLSILMRLSLQNRLKLLDIFFQHYPFKKFNYDINVIFEIFHIPTKDSSIFHQIIESKLSHLSIVYFYSFDYSEILCFLTQYCQKFDKKPSEVLLSFDPPTKEMSQKILSAYQYSNQELLDLQALALSVFFRHICFSPQYSKVYPSFLLNKSPRKKWYSGFQIQPRFSSPAQLLRFVGQECSKKIPNDSFRKSLYKSNDIRQWHQKFKSRHVVHSNRSREYFEIEDLLSNYRFKIIETLQNKPFEILEIHWNEGLDALQACLGGQTAWIHKLMSYQIPQDPSIDILDVFRYLTFLQRSFIVETAARQNLALFRDRKEYERSVLTDVHYYKVILDESHQAGLNAVPFYCSTSDSYAKDLLPSPFLTVFDDQYTTEDFLINYLVACFDYSIVEDSLASGLANELQNVRTFFNQFLTKYPGYVFDPQYFEETSIPMLDLGHFITEILQKEGSPIQLSCQGVLAEIPFNKQAFIFKPFSVYRSA